MVNTQIRLMMYCSQPKMEKLYTVSKTRPGADYSSDHELIAIFRVQLKKVRKTIRPFRYDLNQIPYNYTVEVTNRFKGFDLIECLKNYGQRFITLYMSCTHGHDQNYPQEKEMQKGKMIVWGDRTIADSITAIDNSCQFKEIFHRGRNWVMRKPKLWEKLQEQHTPWTTLPITPKSLSSTTFCQLIPKCWQTHDNELISVWSFNMFRLWQVAKTSTSQD